MTIADAMTLERTRDLQAEIGATLDRFHLNGVSPQSILEVLSTEAELWVQRLGREANIKAAHERQQ